MVNLRMRLARVAGGLTAAAGRVSRGRLSAALVVLTVPRST
jgi:hypothetical protein